MNQDNNQIMPAIAPDDVKHIGLVGTGTIGSAWAAHFLAQGLDVTATDPSPKAEQVLRDSVDRAWPSLVQLGLAEGASKERLYFKTAMDDALSMVDFVQESTPEDEGIKDQVIMGISEVARPDIVIASSTSGIMPSRLQAQCKHPHRMIVAHPFNPAHLMPLVEVVGGQRTAPEIIAWAVDFYRHWGKTPLHCRAEIPGHFANRLQDAVSNEVLQLVTDGIATPGELDIALTAGPGLRWALLGASMISHLAAGSGGIRDTLAGKFGSSYSRYFQGDETLSEARVEQIIEDVESRSGGRSIEEIAQLRDEFLVGVLKLRAELESKYGFNQSRFL